jgi:DNA-binding transcriptional MerR regulator
MEPRIAAERLLADIVELRRALRETRERSVRARLRSVEQSLRVTLGPSVAKKAAANALGVSVTTLDAWVDRGVIPVVGRTGSSRHGIETGPFLDLLEEVTRVRSTGLERGVIALAVKRLGWRDDPNGRRVIDGALAELPRPNVSVRELRDDYERTTPEQRVVQAAHLSSVLTRLAVLGRETRV